MTVSIVPWPYAGCFLLSELDFCRVLPLPLVRLDVQIEERRSHPLHQQSAGSFSKL